MNGSARSPELRRVAIVGGACIAGLGLMGFAAYRAPDLVVLDAFDVRDLRITVPSLVVAGFLTGAAVLCRLLGAPHRADRAQRTATWLFVLLALDEVGRLHERVALRTGSTVVWDLVPLVVGVTASLLALGLVRGPPRRLLAAGATLWAVAQLLSAFESGTPSLGFLGELLDLPAAGLIAFSLLVAVERDVRPPSDRPSWRAPRVVVLDAIRDAPVGWVALGLAACNAVVLVVGWLVAVGDVPIELFDPRGELGFGAWLDVTMLLAAAGLLVLLGRSADTRSEERWLLLMAAVFAAMAVDEALAFHEKIGDRLGLSGQGQLVLTPLILVAFAAWLWTLRHFWHDAAARALFFAGAAVWVASQAVDLLYGGVVAETPASAALEDSLEAIGSTLFALSALIFAKRTSRDGTFLDGAATPRRGRVGTDTPGREFRDTPA